MTGYTSAEHTKQNRSTNFLAYKLLTLTFYCLLSQKSLLHAAFHFRKVRMHVHTNNKITRIYNVIGILRGAVEPGEHQVLDDFNSFFILCLVKLFSGCKKLQVF